DITYHAEHFALLIDRDRVVFPRRRIEPSHFGPLERAQRGQRGAVDLLFCRKAAGGGEGFLTLFEDEHEGAPAIFFRSQCGIHGFLLHFLRALTALLPARCRWVGTLWLCLAGLRQFLSHGVVGAGKE